MNWRAVSVANCALVLIEPGSPLPVRVAMPPEVVLLIRKARVFRQMHSGPLVAVSGVVILQRAPKVLLQGSSVTRTE